MKGENRRVERPATKPHPPLGNLFHLSEHFFPWKSLHRWDPIMSCRKGSNPSVPDKERGILICERQCDP